MNPYDAYVNTATMTMSDREVEAAALTKAAALLKACQTNWNASHRERNLTEALEFNQKLWCIFQASLAAPDHPLPAGLRLNVLRLGSFIDKRIFDVMAYPAPEKLTVIIAINLNLAAGLRVGAPGAENWQPIEIETDALREESVWA
jgi:flagellar protein FlaF